MSYDIQESMGYLSRRASKAIGKRLLENFSRVGYKLNAYQWMVLTYLNANDYVPQNELAEFTGKDKAGITRIIDTLEAQNYLRRRQDTRDRRSNQIFLTDEGRAFVQKLTTIADNTLSELYEGISPRQLETTRKVMNKILENARQLNTAQD